MRISDWSSDVCSSDLQREVPTMSDVHDDEEGVDYAAELERPRQPGSDVEVMLRRLHDVVGSARPMPLSTSVMINRDEVPDALDEIIERLPAHRRAARWLRRAREGSPAPGRPQGG